MRAILDRPMGVRILMAAAEHYPLSRLDDRQLFYLYMEQVGAQHLILRNPDLTDEQLWTLLTLSLPQGGSPLGMAAAISILEDAGRAFPRERLLTHIRELLRDNIDRDLGTPNYRTAEELVGAMIRAFWFDLEESDLQLCLDSWSIMSQETLIRTTICEQILEHPAVTIAMVQRIADALTDGEHDLMDALALCPLIEHLPDVRTLILEKHPSSLRCAALAPYMEPGEVGEQIGRLARFFAPYGISYLKALAPEQLRHVRPDQLRPLLECDLADVRLEAQLFLVMIGEQEAGPTPPEPQSPPRTLQR